jgi:hypothetical protein
LVLVTVPSFSPRGRQDDVGIGRGFGQEEVLPRMLQVRQRVTGMVEVRPDIAGFSPMMYMP